VRAFATWEEEKDEVYNTRGAKVPAVKKTGNVKGVRLAFKRTPSKPSGEGTP